MQKSIVTLFIIGMLADRSGLAASPWINEFHYDDAGSDTGEFVEIAVPTSLTDLASITLTLYNGGDGRTYGSHSLSTFTAGSTEGDVTFFSKLISGIQNGAPDGMALSWSEGIQFISYEGAFQAANGPAAGLTSVDIGVFQADTGAPDGSSLGLTGWGNQYADFTWTAFDAATPGGLNLGQTVVPEPQTYALLATGGLAVFACCRSKRGRRSEPGRSR